MTDRLFNKEKLVKMRAKLIRQLGHIETNSLIDELYSANILSDGRRMYSTQENVNDRLRELLGVLEPRIEDEDKRGGSTTFDLVLECLEKNKMGYLPEELRNVDVSAAAESSQETGSNQEMNIQNKVVHTSDPGAYRDLINGVMERNPNLVVHTFDPGAYLYIKNREVPPLCNLMLHTSDPHVYRDLKNGGMQPHCDVTLHTSEPGANLDLKNDAAQPHNLDQGMQSLSMNSGRNVASTDEKKIEDFLQSTKKLTKDDLRKISKIFGKGWRSVGGYLGLTENELFAIRHDYTVEGFEEICYQMLCCWYKKDPSQCTVGNLAKALEKNDDTENIFKLPLGE